MPAALTDHPMMVMYARTFDERGRTCELATASCQCALLESEDGLFALERYSKLRARFVPQHRDKGR